MFMLVSFKILTINSDVLALVAPQGINAEIKTEETTLIYPIKLNTYLGAVVLSHDAYSSNSAKSIERLTTTKNGVRNDDLSTIVLRKVLVKDSSAYTAGGAHVFIFGI